MIAECLQKDPSKRPTATELLKHQFFKKAKDKKYLVQTCLSCAPSIEERAKKAKNFKRPPGASGRFHKTETGEWKWSDDSDYDDFKEKSSDPSKKQQTNNQQQENNDKLKNLTLNNESNSTNKLEQQQENQVPSTNGSQEKISLVLRMRNSRKALNDIKFDFLINIGNLKNEVLNF